MPDTWDHTAGAEETWVDSHRGEGGARDLVGQTVSRYRVLARLGAGGMGVVYRAEDTSLGRAVALKFLPPGLASDPRAKKRFLREARAASALDHPNLCTVYEIGETGDGRLFLAMACYDGETLKQRLERGPLPPAEAVDIACQAARGLAKAHRHGIVHRDVKPANLMLTTDGLVKVLDFGIAKLAGETALTRQGRPMGTVAYMAPEQIRGEEVDHRADLWSLGVVFYEMLTGQRPFAVTPDLAAHFYAILHLEPKPLRVLRPDVPPELERTVQRMLAKAPAQRHPSLDEVLAELGATRGTVSGAVPVMGPHLRFRRSWVWAGLTLVTLGIGLAAVPRWRAAGGEALSATPAPRPTFHRLTDREGRETSPTLSPGGDLVAYVQSDGGDLDIFLERVGSGSPVNLTADSPADDLQPAFSPDGRQIAFRSEREGGGIWLMGTRGGPARLLTDFGYDPAWSPDGTEILLSTDGVRDPRVRLVTSQLWRVAVASGEGRRIVDADAVQPSWSPHGWRIAYWGTRGGRRVITTDAPEGGDPVVVVEDAYLNWCPVWAPDGGHLYFASDRGGSMGLWRVPLDEKSGRVLGEPEPLQTPAEWSARPSLSRDGRWLAYATDDGRQNVERVPFDPERGEVTGPLMPVTSRSWPVSTAEPSPDGRWIAFNALAPTEDIFLIRPDGTGLRRLTDDLHKDRNPRWSPAGDRVLFYSNRAGRYQAWSIRLDGSGLQRLTANEGEATDPHWSPDGRWLAVHGPTRLLDLRRILPDRPLPPLEGGEFGVTSWSPDGRWLAGLDTHRPGLVLYSLDTGAYRRLTESGRGPVWLPGGVQLLYREENGIFLLDRRTTRTRLVLAAPPHSRFVNLAVAADGRSIYVVRATDEGDIWMLDHK